MTDLVLIVEGHGDVDAFPVLTGKIGGWLALPVFTKNPIRSGGWGCIKKPGGLEKFVALAASREECKRVVVVVDLDDDCPVDERVAVQGRATALAERHQIEISICFCIREYEAWILHNINEIMVSNPQINNNKNEFIHNDICSIRDAKGTLRRHLSDGYSESSDQIALTRLIDPALVYERSRSFRSFVKAVSGLQYDAIAVPEPIVQPEA